MKDFFYYYDRLRTLPHVFPDQAALPKEGVGAGGAEATAQAGNLSAQLVNIRDNTIRNLNYPVIARIMRTRLRHLSADYADGRG
jgi:hypothetical protein